MASPRGEILMETVPLLALRQPNKGWTPTFSLHVGCTVKGCWAQWCFQPCQRDLTAVFKGIQTEGGRRKAAVLRGSVSVHLPQAGVPLSPHSSLRQIWKNVFFSMWGVRSKGKIAWNHHIHSMKLHCLSARSKTLLWMGWFGWNRNRQQSGKGKTAIRPTLF